MGTRNVKLVTYNTQNTVTKTGSTTITQAKSTNFNLGSNNHTARSASRKSSYSSASSRLRQGPAPLVKKFKVSRASQGNFQNGQDVYQSPYSPKNAKKLCTAVGSRQTIKKNSFSKLRLSKEEIAQNKEETKQYKGMFRNCLNKKKKEDLRKSKDRKR